jgi:hypothetical protein
VEREGGLREPEAAQAKEGAETTQPPMRERTGGCKKAIDRDNSYDGATILEDFRVSEETLLIAPERR